MNDNNASSSSSANKRYKQDDEDGQNHLQYYDNRREASPYEYDHDKKDVKVDIATSYAKMAARPEHGRDGHPIDLLVNFYKLRLLPIDDDQDDLVTIYHYDLHITDTGVAPGKSSTPPIPLLAKIWEQARNTNPTLRDFFETAAFDGMKNVYSPVRLENHGVLLDVRGEEELEIKVEFFEEGNDAPHGRGRDFSMALKIVAVIKMDDLFDYTHKSVAGEQSLPAGPKAQAAIQALDVLLRSVLSKNPIYTISAARGRKHYDGRQSHDIGRGGEVLQGHFASVRPTEGGTFVNIDTIYSPFIREGPLIDVCTRLLGGQIKNDGKVVSYLTRLLRGARARKTYGTVGKKVSIKGFRASCAADLRFKDRDGNTQTLPLYFQQTYNIHLRYPDLPLVEIGGKNILIPMELVVLEPGAPIPFARISSEQTANMIKISAKKPHLRRQDIDRQMDMASYQSSTQVKAWRVSISTSMERVDGRVLAAPRIQYHASSRDVRGGAWNTMGLRLLTPNNELRSWAIVNFDHRFSDQAAEGFIRRLVDSCQRMGMVISYIPRVQRGGQLLEKSLEDAGREAYQSTGVAPQLIVAIAPDRNAYEGIKYAALFKMPSPVPTQILLSSKLSKPKGLDSYIANVALKLNVKLCGSNCPRAVRSNEPSISALVASTDGTHAAFQTEVRLQTPRVEIIEDFGEMFRELLLKFHDRTGRWPKSIIVFRDGLSEGEYARANEREVHAIKSVCIVEGATDVKVTFVICAKRHRVRAFPASSRDEDRSGNAPPGTLFILTSSISTLSHSGLVGTAKPTHYIVIRNDHNFSSDALQKLCYNLSHTFARATRSVSVVPPAYYAHIVAQRCRALFDHEEGSNTEVSSGSGGHAPVVFDKFRIKNALEKRNGMPGMWFM
ncbi:ribonuclease H-like domain-containing protein [Mrakia frigida]|uniref:ribonuclease H-like domain-containing protein n=1 Tax=Mrakia frigida TaxID=29902 RepID=UPI003FCBEFC8